MYKRAGAGRRDLYRATHVDHFFFFLPISAAAACMAFFSSACFLRKATSSCSIRPETVSSGMDSSSACASTIVLSPPFCTAAHAHHGALSNALPTQRERTTSQARCDPVMKGEATKKLSDRATAVALRAAPPSCPYIIHRLPLRLRLLSRRRRALPARASWHPVLLFARPTKPSPPVEFFAPPCQPW